MTGLPTTYYRVCDRCGYLASIGSAEDPSEYVCVNCGSLAAWEYPSLNAALQQSRDIKDRHTV